MRNENAVHFKFIVIGCSGTGKTAIVRRLVDDKFVKGAQSTVGIEFFTFIHNIDGRTVRMMIWDTAGQERFYTLAKTYYRSALGVVLVFDITDRKSFDQLPRWLRDVRIEADPHCSIILVGNKIDLASKRNVSREETEEFARNHELQYIETSALDNSNILEAFIMVGSDLLKKISTGDISPSVSASDNGVSVRETSGKSTDNSCC